MSSDDWGRLRGLSEQELFVELGEQLSPGVGRRDPKYLAAVARAWFADRAEEFRRVVCGSEVVRLAQQSGDEAVLLSAVADLIAPLVGILPAATVAVLLTRYGIDRLCGVDDGSDN